MFPKRCKKWFFLISNNSFSQSLYKNVVFSQGFLYCTYVTPIQHQNTPLKVVRWKFHFLGLKICPEWCKNCSRYFKSSFTHGMYRKVILVKNPDIVGMWQQYICIAVTYLQYQVFWGGKICPKRCKHFSRYFKSSFTHGMYQKSGF